MVFIIKGRWNESLLPNILPLYEETFELIDKKLPKVRKCFCDHLTAIALYSSTNPIEWLFEFLKKASPENRVEFAKSIYLGLKKVNKEARKALWV